MVPEKAGEDSIKMKVCITYWTLSCPWNWTMRFSYIGWRLSNVLKLVSCMARIPTHQVWPESASFSAWLYALASHAGLLEGQQFHMIQHRTLAEWSPWKSNHSWRMHRGVRAETPIPTGSAWNLLGSKMGNAKSTGLGLRNFKHFLPCHGLARDLRQVAAPCLQLCDLTELLQG